MMRKPLKPGNWHSGMLSKVNDTIDSMVWPDESLHASCLNSTGSKPLASIVL